MLSVVEANQRVIPRLGQQMKQEERTMVDRQDRCPEQIVVVDDVFHHSHHNHHHRHHHPLNGDVVATGNNRRDCSYAIPSEALIPTNSLGGLNRTKSIFSMTSSLSASSSEDSLLETDMTTTISPNATLYFSFDEAVNPHAQFGHDLRECTEDDAYPAFDSQLRKAMEPHLRQSRVMRERCRKRTILKVDASIASSVGVPYTALRHERPFLFDEHTYPLHQILAQTLRVEDLTKIHQVASSEEILLKPLLEREQRRPFHQAYDSFVTSFCIPLLHSLAISKNIFHTSSSDRITYRYQAFPSINIVRPGGRAMAPICDAALGHSIGCLNFHIPLTPSFGTNALHVESHPGREDWHALSTKSVGLGYLFDGARCLHFCFQNTTDATRVSLDFRVMIYRERRINEMEIDSGLCPPELLEDSFSRDGPGYYDEATIDLSRDSRPGQDIVVKKNGRQLLEPDVRAGPPFV